MKAKEFLQQQILKLSELFPATNFKYGYHPAIMTHIVIIAPESDFEKNDKLDDAWIPLSFDFKLKFPTEEIAFVPPSSSISNVQIEFEYNKINNDLLNYELYDDIAASPINYSFPVSVNTKTVINTSFTMLNSPAIKVEVEKASPITYQLAA